MYDTSGDQNGSRFIATAAREHDTIVVFDDHGGAVARRINNLPRADEIYSATKVSISHH